MHAYKEVCQTAICIQKMYTEIELMLLVVVEEADIAYL